MLTDLRLDNRRGWVSSCAKSCTCLIGLYILIIVVLPSQICHAISNCASAEILVAHAVCLWFDILVSMVFGDPQALSSVLAELGYRAFGSLRSRTLDDCI